MPKSDKQKLKLIYLLRILLNNTDMDHGMTMQDIINALAKEDISAERKSVYSDIALLNDAGYDIIHEKDGRNIVYKMAGRDFELPELKLLVDAVQSSKFITESKSNKLIKKIESLASIHEAKSLHRQVYVANRIKTTNESVFYTVDDIQKAISENTKISFQYFQWNVKKEKELRHNGLAYVISPWALTWDDENYYMIGYDGKDEKIKHFRVDKMLKVKTLDEKREGKELFSNMDTAVYTKKIFGMFGGSEETVTLKCRTSMSGVIVDRFGTGVNITNITEEYFNARVSVQVSPQFFGWLFSLGDAVEIMEPSNVKERMKEEIKKIAKMYK